MTPTEREQAIWIANKALDVPNADPDDDLRTVSRQFLRSIELHDKARNQAIDDVIKRLSIMVHYGNIDLSWSFIKEEIEQLKTKP